MRSTLQRACTVVFLIATVAATIDCHSATTGRAANTTAYVPAVGLPQHRGAAYAYPGYRTWNGGGGPYTGAYWGGGPNPYGSGVITTAH